MLIFAPIGKDGNLVASTFRGAGIDCLICSSLAEINEEIRKDVGALFIVDDVLTPDFLAMISRFLSIQPTWSDLPILVLSKNDLDSFNLKGVSHQLGNLTLLERPVRRAILVSAARSALRARKRQYEMRDVDRRKDEFLAMLAHELRNPLAPISAAADLLQVMAPEENRVRTTSKIIARHVRHMSELIDDLMDASRVTQGLVTLEKDVLDVKKIFADAVEQSRPLIEKRRHRFGVEISPDAAYILGDQKRLIQVLTNLLNNAAKYTPEGGVIDLRLEVDDAFVTFIVADNGIGMAPELLPLAFQLFVQAERTPDRSQGGLGIGLALVKSLVELHRGTVSVKSAGIDQGSEFTVRLPRLAEADLPMMESTDTVAANVRKHLRIMVVDDNVDAAVLLSMYLEAAGHVVMVEHTSANALRRGLEERPDVFLLDIGLPDMNGNELARLLKAQPETSKALLIAITGYGQAQDRNSTAQAGFAHHFVKPVDTARLAQALMTHSQRAQEAAQ
ncbi:MAG: hybrid sensor histidine kinase/response regulator [Janthinobacterium lividum]